MEGKGIMKFTEAKLEQAKLIIKAELLVMS